MRKLIVSITFLAVFAMSARIAVDTDTWWHLRTGEIIFETKSLPTEDSYSHTRLGEDWQGASVGWVMQVVLYKVFDAFSFGGLNILQAVMVTATFYFVYRTLSGGVFTNAFLIIFAATVSAVYWAARPYLMSFLLASITFSILEDFRWRAKDRLWLLPLIMVLWSNSHGGFAIGLLIWGVYASYEGLNWLTENKFVQEKSLLQNIKNWLLVGLKGRLGKMILIGVLMLIGASINRLGASIWLYPFNTVSISSLQNFIQEWQSPNFHNIQMQPFAWMLLLSLGVIGISQQRLALTDFLLVAGFGYLSFLAARNIAVFALVTPAVLSRHLAPIGKKIAEKYHLFEDMDRKVPPVQNIINLGIMLLFAFVVLVKIISVMPDEQNWSEISEQIPVDAIDFILKEQPEGEMLNSYNWGGYLIWALRDYPVFVDGRTDLYGDEIILEWLNIVSAGEGWQEMLVERNIHMVLLERSWPITKLLETEGWHKLYQDDLAVVYAEQE